MKQTKGMRIKQIASNWMEHRMTAVSGGFQINRKVKLTKVMIELMNRMFILYVNSCTPAWNWYCPTTPAWRKQKCKQSLLPTPNSKSERHKKRALGASLKVDVIEGDGNCLFRK